MSLKIGDPVFFPYGEGSVAVVCKFHEEDRFDVQFEDGDIVEAVDDADVYELEWGTEEYNKIPEWVKQWKRGIE